MQILKHMVLLDLSGISLWSGRAKLRPEDLGIDDSQLPPETLASLGSLKIFSRERLTEFQRLRARAHRESFKRGTRFLSGYAIPNTHIDALVDLLESIREQFDAAKARFVSEYDEEFERWVQQFPSYESVLRRAKKDVNWVDQRLHFGYTPVPIDPRDESTVIGKRLGESAAGIYGRLLYEVAEVAEEALKESLSDKLQVTRRALRPFKALRAKLAAFDFLRPGIQIVVDIIDQALQQVPVDNQPIKGRALILIVSLAKLLADPHRLRDVIENSQPDNEGQQNLNVLALDPPAEESGADLADAIAQAAVDSSAVVPETADHTEPLPAVSMEQNLTEDSAEALPAL
jgi:hypothetical protein